MLWLASSIKSLPRTVQSLAILPEACHLVETESCDSGVTRAPGEEFMAKDKKKAKGKKAKPGKVEKKFRKATEKAAKLAANPIVAEIASAALLAAAAAVRNPDKARKLAKAAGDELSEAARLTAKQGGAFWQLAVDIARRSVDSLAEEGRKGAKGKK
jgi:hypothetical protein